MPGHTGTDVTVAFSQLSRRELSLTILVTISLKSPAVEASAHATPPPLIGDLFLRFNLI